VVSQHVELSALGESIIIVTRFGNPILSLKFLKIFVFRQEFEVCCFRQSSNLASVESFWKHEFIEKHWPFSAHVKSLLDQ